MMCFILMGDIVLSGLVIWGKFSDVRKKSFGRGRLMTMTMILLCGYVAPLLQLGGSVSDYSIGDSHQLGVAINRILAWLYMLCNICIIVVHQRVSSELTAHRV